MPETAAELAGAQEEIARLARLVSGLLAVARAENVTAAPVPVAVDAVRRGPGRGVAAGGRRARRHDRRARPWRRSAPGCGDGDLEQILDNLLANALDVLDAGRTITVSAAATGGRARITVADNGPRDDRRAAAGRVPPVRVRGSRGVPGSGWPSWTGWPRPATAPQPCRTRPGGGLTVTIDLPAAAPRHH